MLRKQHVLFFLFLFANIAAAQSIQVSGIVRDEKGQVVPLASIEVKRLTRVYVNGNYLNQRTPHKALTADTSGHYRVLLPANQYIFEVAALGFLKKSKYINLTENTVLDIELAEQVNQLEAVEIAVRKAENNVKSIEAGMVKLNMQAIKTTPIVFGEGDIIRTLTLQTGVTNVGEGAGGFSVRGGRTDQNLVLLDDAPLFNTSHLLGLFTSVNSEAVQNATLYKAGIPARYGGRLSSLLQMNTKVGSREKHTSVGVGPITSNVLIERPFAKGKGSFLLAGRGAYPNWIIGGFPKRFNGSRAAFYDLNASAQYRSGNNSFSATAYRSSDNFKFPEDTSYFWHSNILTMQWNKFINSRLSMNTKAILSHYDYGVNGLSDTFEYKLTSKNKHHELRHEYVFEINAKHKLEWGGNIILYRFSPGTRVPKGEKSVVNPYQVADEYGRESAAFVSYDWEMNKWLSLQVGSRYSSFQNLGGRVFVYEPNQVLSPESIVDTLQYTQKQSNANFGGFEPRVLLKIGLGDSQSLKLSYNRTRQYLHLITNTTAISPVDYWKLSNRYAPPQQAHLYSVGYYKNFRDNMFITNLEGFYKKMTQLVEYKDGASLLLNPHLETELLPAEGYAYGGELSVQKNKGSLTGFVNYTYSRSMVATKSVFLKEQLNKGDYFPSIFDKPHNLNVSGQWTWVSGWSLSSNFVYQTGRPLTFPDGQYSFNDNLMFNYSARYGNRLPDYHRLDLSVSYNSRKNKEQKKYNVFNFSIYNVYARKNPYSIFFRQFYGYPKSYKLSVLGTLIPSITLTKYW